MCLASRVCRQHLAPTPMDTHLRKYTLVWCTEHSSHRCKTLIQRQHQTNHCETLNTDGRSLPRVGTTPALRRAGFQTSFLCVPTPEHSLPEWQTTTGPACGIYPIRKVRQKNQELTPNNPSRGWLALRVNRKYAHGNLWEMSECKLENVVRTVMPLWL